MATRHMTSAARADVWRRLPRGIAIGTLLAVPFWIVPLAWLLW